MLSDALTTLHRDPHWWRKILLGGALLASIVGWPLAAGMVVESMENSRRGYPTPLPPWHAWGTRYLVGLFALLIDLVLFGLPLLLAGLLLLCGGAALAATAHTNPTALLLLLAGSGGLLLLCWLLAFLGSLAPVARLRYTHEGRIEDALDIGQLRRAHTRRGVLYWRARRASLPAYLPALLLLGLALWLLQQPFAWCALPLALLGWLACSALLYAHLVVVQLYVAAERTTVEENTHLHHGRS